MFEHLSNCHGEWNAIIALLGSAPFFGAWIRVKINNKKEINNELV